MTAVTEHGPKWKPLIGSGVFALLWVLVAVARPTTTFHLAPAIVALWPALAGGGGRKLLISATGFLLAALATLLLSATGMLQGPTLLRWGGPAVESFFAAGVGASLGFFISWGKARDGANVLERP